MVYHWFLLAIVYGRVRVGGLLNRQNLLSMTKVICRQSTKQTPQFLKYSQNFDQSGLGFNNFISDF